MYFQQTTRSFVIVAMTWGLFAGCDEPADADTSGISVAEFEEATRDFGDCSEDRDGCSWLGSGNPCVCGMAITLDHHDVFKDLSSSVMCEESEYMSCVERSETYCDEGGVCVAAIAVW